MVNNLANSLSSRGVNVAILDTTKNKDSYYIYTKNEEVLRRIAYVSIDNLQKGIANGLKVENNLTVYTGLPNETKSQEDVEPILETLLKNHDVILLDCDLDTLPEYFYYANTVFIVQSMDILPIQPLTEFLANLENNRVLDSNKIKVIINKYFELEGITEREILSGLAFYNDATMSYTKKIFEKENVQYITIPFFEKIYKEYINMIIKCDINIESYPFAFLEILNDLADEVYPSKIENK